MMAFNDTDVRVLERGRVGLVVVGRGGGGRFSLNASFFFAVCPVQICEGETRFSNNSTSRRLTLHTHGR